MLPGHQVKCYAIEIIHCHCHCHVRVHEHEYVPMSEVCKILKKCAINEVIVNR